MRNLLDIFKLTLHVHDRWGWLNKFIGPVNTEFYQEELVEMLAPSGDLNFIALYHESYLSTPSDPRLMVPDFHNRKYLWKYTYEDKAKKLSKS